MTAVLRWRVALVSALSAALLIAAPLAGAQTAYARTYPPSPSPNFYPPRPHPSPTVYPTGRPHPHHTGGPGQDSGHLAGTGMETGTLMVMGSAAVALIAAGGVALIVRRRRNY